MHPNQTRYHASWRQTIAALIVLVGLLLPALPARAVFNGKVDAGNKYSNVGIVFPERTGPGNSPPPDIISGNPCNGVLIAERLVLTVADCVGAPWDDFAYVSFAPDYDPLYDYGDENLPPLEVDGEPLAPWEEGDPICREPCYLAEVIRAQAKGNGSSWLAILRLEESPVLEEDIEIAPLPAPNLVQGIAGELVTTVGYNDVVCEDNPNPPGAPWDCDDLEDILDTPFEDNQIPGRHIHLTERRYKDLTVQKVTGQALQVDAVLNCDDLGGGNFDAEGVLVALTHNHDCKKTEVRRIDTTNERAFLCSAKFPELAETALCGGSAAAAKAAAAGGDKQSADRQHKGKSEAKHKGKKGKQNRGKRGR